MDENFKSVPRSPTRIIAPKYHCIPLFFILHHHPLAFRSSSSASPCSDYPAGRHSRLFTVLFAVLSAILFVSPPRTLYSSRSLDLRLTILLLDAFSSYPDLPAFFARKQQEEARGRGEFVDIHNICSLDPNDFDVLIIDIERRNCDLKLRKS